MSEKQVTIYTAPECGISEQLEQFLANHGVSYQEIDLTDKPEMVEKLCQKVDGQRRGPVIEIGSTTIAGFDLEKVEAALAQHFGI